jgi:hypothetical protein
LVEFWVDVRIKERCIQLAELRGIDPGHEFLQVFVHPFEPKIRESGEDRANWRKWMSRFEVGKRMKGWEFKFKCFEAGQHGKGSGHRLG